MIRLHRRDDAELCETRVVRGIGDLDVLDAVTLRLRALECVERESNGGVPDAVQGPDTLATDLDGACARYEAVIDDAGGIDLQILGIGSDGHIGFNEPASSLASRTRVKTLTRRTRDDNARFFDDDPEAVPHHVVTQGIGTILAARHLVLVATGATKADPVTRAVEGPITAMVPASALQLHPRATVVIDEEAATGLELADYYREAYGTGDR